MASFIIRRLIALIPVMCIVLVIVFSLVRMIPGDPAVTLLGPGATQEQILALRAQLDLDQTVLLQFVHYVLGLFSRRFWHLAQDWPAGCTRNSLPFARDHRALGPRGNCGHHRRYSAWRPVRHTAKLDLRPRHPHCVACRRFDASFFAGSDLTAYLRHLSRVAACFGSDELVHYG